MIGRAGNGARWLWLGLAIGTALAAVDALLGGQAVLIGLLVVPPLLVAARAGARATAIVAGYALVLSIVLGIPDDDFGNLDHLLRILVVLAGSALAVWIASLRERAEQAEARSTFVAEAGARLDTSLDFETTVNALTRIPVPLMADWCAVYELSEDSSIRQLAIAHVDPAKEEVAREIERLYPFHVDQPIGVGTVIRTGEPALMGEVTDATIDASSHDERHAGLVRSLGLRSAIFVPLKARGRTLGAMAFATAKSGRSFGADDFALAESLADRAALALDNAQLYTDLSQVQAELRESADEVEAVLQGVASAITVQDPNGRLVYANQAAAEALGFRSVEDLLDTPPEEILERFETFDEAGEPFPAERLPGRVVLAGGQPSDTVVGFKSRITGEERWSMVRAAPIFDDQGRTRLAVNIFDDITKQKRDELAERFLSESSGLLAASIDYEATLDNIAHLAVPRLADWCAVDIVDDRGSIRNVALAYADPSRLEQAEEMGHRYPVDFDSARGVQSVIRTGEPELYSDLSEELLVEGAHAEHLEMLRLIGVRSVIIVPMTMAGTVLGAITFCTAESRRQFDERDLELAQELGRRAASAVENARLYQERSHIARTLQRSLLPPVLPHIPGVEVAARFRPAGEGYDVGGDFYDVFNTGGGGWGVVIGDVCGKGPEAAALTGLARHTLRAAAMQENDPSRILGLLSEAILRERSDSEFCTAAYGRLELGTTGARLTVASGGHPLPFLLTEDGRVEQIGVPGTLLGFTSDTKLIDHPLDLEPGATLVFYTDGVIEAGSPRGAFGLGALKALLETCTGLSAQEVAERIDSAVVALQDSPPDDVAVLVLRISE